MKVGNIKSLTSNSRTANALSMIFIRKRGVNLFTLITKQLNMGLSGTSMSFIEFSNSY